jgi:hypothetical protein
VITLALVIIALALLPAALVVAVYLFAYGVPILLILSGGVLGLIGLASHDEVTTGIGVVLALVGIVWGHFVGMID